MEHSDLLHLPMAKGRIENGLPPAPRKVNRLFHKKWAEALSVLAGRSIAVRCYDDRVPEEGVEPYVSGSVSRHPIVEQSE